MSHFSVAAFTKENQTVEDLLAPFQENNMGDCPKEYLQFYDVEQETFEEYHNSGIEMVRLTDGSLRYKWDEMFKKCGTDENDIDTFELPQGCELVFVKHIDRFSSFYDFMRDWMGFEEKDSETGKYGHWENPNAKWDWWVIGGRFSGMLKERYTGCDKPERIKESTLPSNEKPDRDALIKDANGNLFLLKNSSKIKNVDFSIDMDEYQKALRFWELKIEKKPIITESDKTILKGFNYIDAYYTSRYATKEDYAKSRAQFITFAVITPDGKWHTAGDMGWFGCSGRTIESERQWEKSYAETFIKTADPEWTLTVVDCHI